MRKLLFFAALNMVRANGTMHERTYGGCKQACQDEGTDCDRSQSAESDLCFARDDSFYSEEHDEYRFKLAA